MGELFPSSETKLRNDIQPTGSIWWPLLLAAVIVGLLVVLLSAPWESKPQQAAVPAGSMTVVDQMLEGGRYRQALGLIQRRLDEAPDDAQLRWRLGKARALENRKAAAFMAYRDALQGDPRLRSDEQFVAELAPLMREPALRPEAIDLAIRVLGEHGHWFLLERINDGRDPLPYNERRRALDRIETDPEVRGQVDTRLNIALDLRQASDADDPCTAFGDALTKIEGDPEQYDESALAGVRAPTEQGTEACRDLGQRLAALRPRLSASAQQ